jgi:[calcium/calmodulin-dependent protein kinase] kinase
VHFCRIIHCDIKPENLLVNGNGMVQIGDFGVSRMLEKSRGDWFQIKTTSPLFTPPCALSGNCILNVEGSTNINGKLADIWSLGVTLYCFAHGHCPFEDDTEVGLYQKILEDEVVIRADLSENWRDIILKILMKNVKYRISISKIRTHQWVTKNGTWPMKSKDDNCTIISEILTDDELQKAFKPARKAVNTNVIKC